MSNANRCPPRHTPLGKRRRFSQLACAVVEPPRSQTTPFCFFRSGGKLPLVCSSRRLVPAEVVASPATATTSVLSALPEKVRILIGADQTQVDSQPPEKICMQTMWQEVQASGPLVSITPFFETLLFRSRKNISTTYAIVPTSQ